MKRYIIPLVLIWLTTMPGHGQVLNLDSCRVYALENNRKLKEARLELEASEQVKKNAFTKYFPNVSAGAVAMKALDPLVEAEIPEMNLPVYDGNPVNLLSPTQYAYFPGLELDLLDYANVGYVMAVQPVFLGGRIINGNKLATVGVEAGEYKLDLSEDEILAQTESYYWQIVALKEKEITLTSYENLLNNLLGDVQAAYDAGLIQKSDVLKVQLEINSIKTKRIRLENGLSLLKMAMCQYIGVHYNDSIAFADNEIDIITPEEIYKEPETAIEERSEYKLLNKALEAEELRKKMELGEHLPTLAVGAQGLYLDFMDSQNTNGLAFATLSIPISGWWGGSHKIKEQQIKVEIAKNNLEEKTELLLLQIDKAYKELNESFEQISVAQISVQQAEEHLTEVQNNYDAGILKTSDLLEAQAIFQDAKDALVEAKTDYKIKQIYYYKATAGISL